MDVWRAIFGWWEEGVKKLKDEISVREGELGVDHRFHGIGQHGNVYRLLVDTFNDVQPP